MICPNCRSLVADGTYICDNCNAIVDASFLGDGITNEAPVAEDATRIKNVSSDATRIKQVDPNQTRIKPVDANATRVKAAPEPKPRKAKAVDDDFEEPKKSLLDSAAPPPQTAEALEQLVQQFRSLPWSDQLTGGGALGLLLSMGLPWKSTLDEGDIIGFVAGAWPIALVALVVGSAVFLRRHPRALPFRGPVLGLNAGLAALGLVGAVAFWRSVGVQQIFKAGGRLVTQSIVRVEFGVFLGILAAAAMLLGAVFTWLERDKLAD